VRRRYAFAEFSDATGSFEVTLFSETLATSSELLEANQPLLLTVEIRAEDEQLRLTAQDVTSLDRAAARAVKGLRIVIADEVPLPALGNILGATPAGRAQRAPHRQPRRSRGGFDPGAEPQPRPAHVGGAARGSGDRRGRGTRLKLLAKAVPSRYLHPITHVGLAAVPMVRSLR